MTLGRKLIRDERKIEKIVIYKKDHNGEYKLDKLLDFPFQKACPNFCFDIDPAKGNFLTFFSKKEVFRFDYTQKIQ